MYVAIYMVWMGICRYVCVYVCMCAWLCMYVYVCMCIIFMHACMLQCCYVCMWEPMAAERLKTSSVKCIAIYYALLFECLSCKAG